jgi:hypothetical protein
MSNLKRYILTIEYNTETEEIEYIQEEIVDDEPLMEYGEVILNDYFDEETLALFTSSYIMGIS